MPSVEELCLISFSQDFSCFMHKFFSPHCTRHSFKIFDEIELSKSKAKLTTEGDVTELISAAWVCCVAPWALWFRVRVPRNVYMFVSYLARLGLT